MPAAASKDREKPKPGVYHVPAALAKEIRALAKLESESQSFILRKLLRLGLAAERRSV